MRSRSLQHGGAHRWPGEAAPQPKSGVALQPSQPSDPRVPSQKPPPPPTQQPKPPPTREPRQEPERQELPTPTPPPPEPTPPLPPDLGVDTGAIEDDVGDAIEASSGETVESIGAKQTAVRAGDGGGGVVVAEAEEDIDSDLE